MKIVGIIQARTTSSRLPNKVLLDLESKTVLEHVYFRVLNSKLINKVIVATSNHPSDNKIEKLCNSKKMNCFRGSLDDVLDRFYHCAKENNSDYVVRITADCPLIDPIIIDSIITSGLEGKYDYFGLGGEFPDGLDCTLINICALEHAQINAELKSDREHVGPFIERNTQKKFKIGSLNLFKGLSNYRWTLDEESDYELIKIIYEKLYDPKKIFNTNEVLDLIAKNPHLSKINSHIIRNEGYLNSIKND
tara:strand:- start:2554 stop:3300 length:747 start_codon:yes stop_codon:yes gene_type:complete